MALLTLEQPRALETAISTLQHGGVVAFPTDTVYGLAASLAHPEAMQRIYEIKQRDTTKPLPVLLASLDDLPTITSEVSEPLHRVARAFWPGPLTIAVPGHASLPRWVMAADGTVGVRIPNHSVALAIAARNGGAIAATSANPSGEAPACRAEDVQAQLGDLVDLILDAGITPGGLSSTVVRPDGDTITVLRAGAIAAEEITAVWRGTADEEPGHTGTPASTVRADPRRGRPSSTR